MRNHKIQKIKLAKKEYLNKINKHLQNSSFTDKLSWRLIRRNKKRSPKSIPTLKHDNKTITNPIEKTEILHSVLSHPDPPKLEPKHVRFHKQITNKVLQIKLEQEHHPIDILNNPIKYYELYNCLQSLEKD